MRSELLLAGVFSTFVAFSALAQNAGSTTQITPSSTASGTPAKGIGPAAPNTPQHHILSGALSVETRQTLQEAMNSAREADTSHPSAPSK